MGCWGIALGPVVIKELNDRIVQIAQTRAGHTRAQDACRHHGG
jgi:hypothetical protein